jgi:seryl-tRNA synthetase
MTIFLLVVAIGLGITAVVLKIWADRARATYEAERAQLQAERDRLAAENQALAVYRPILDVRAEAERILQEARERITTSMREASEQRGAVEREVAERGENAKRDAQALAVQAKAEVEQMRSQAAQALKTTQDRVDSMMRSANREAETVVANANKRAQEIAGDAFQAVQNAERFERAAKAMKNIIEGYGDQWVIPSRSLLDDLAEEYAFAEAGTELKNARDRTRLMVKNGTAATCDYVEENRRETAVRFVVDAFNGKVDSILSRTKHDNVGTLTQEIRDAFTLVNHNGAAFRNARVVDTYLDARLTELRWAAIAQELKLRDREEQRRIKEQIREEEKAQREFERSLREAAKEEEMLRKAMDKIQDQVAKASEAQRQKYEGQLAELADRLRKVEEERQRAKSMAEQTKTGHVYVISNIGSFGEDVFKIGLTRRLEPLDRVRELGDASVPFAFDVHAMIPSNDAPALELALHKHFLAAQMNKVNPRKEFFRVPLAVIREEIDGLRVTAKWTIAAEAKEYRETLALEKTLKADPEKKKAWLREHENADEIIDMDLAEDDQETAGTT